MLKELNSLGVLCWHGEGQSLAWYYDPFSPPWLFFDVSSVYLRNGLSPLLQSDRGSFSVAYVSATTQCKSIGHYRMPWCSVDFCFQVALYPTIYFPPLQLSPQPGVFVILHPPSHLCIQWCTKFRISEQVWRRWCIKPATRWWRVWRGVNNTISLPCFQNKSAQPNWQLCLDHFSQGGNFHAASSLSLLSPLFPDI